MKIKVLLGVLLVGGGFFAGFSIAHDITEERFFDRCVGSLSVRVRHLEHAVAGKLSNRGGYQTTLKTIPGCPPDLREDFLHVEEIQRARGTAEIQRAVHSRILDLAEGLRLPIEFRSPSVR